MRSSSAACHHISRRPLADTHRKHAACRAEAAFAELAETERNAHAWRAASQTGLSRVLQTVKRDLPAPACTEELHSSQIIEGRALHQCLRVAAAMIYWESSALRTTVNRAHAECSHEVTDCFAHPLRLTVDALRCHFDRKADTEKMDQSSSSANAESASEASSHSSKANATGVPRPKPTARTQQCQTGCRCPKADAVVEHLTTICRPDDGAEESPNSLESILWNA